MRVSLLVLLLTACWSCNKPETIAEEPLPSQEVKAPEIAEPGQEKEPPSFVYYRQVNIGALAPLPVNLVRHPEPSVMAKHLIDLLSIPPADSNYEPIWPSNTYVRELFLLPDGNIVVDFDQGFVNSLSIGTSLEEQMVVSLVLTLLENFEAYQSVRILVNGQPQETFLGHVDIEKQLNRTTKLYTVALVKKEEPEIIVEDLEDAPDKP